MNFFLKHQQLILRTLGAVMLLVGFIVNFWVIDMGGVSKNDLAMARIARMEASVSNHEKSSYQKGRPDTSRFTSTLKKTQQKQMKYLTIFVMILGAISLGYGFFKKR